MGISLPPQLPEGVELPGLLVPACERPDPGDGGHPSTSLACSQSPDPHPPQLLVICRL